MAVILPRSAKLNRRAAASGKVTSNARRIGASATPAPDRKLGCSGCAVVGQLRDAFAQNRFLSFALSQTPRQIQRYAQTHIVFAEECDAGLIHAAPHLAGTKRA